MDIEKVKQTILELENKEILTAIEKRKLGLAKWRLNNPEADKERQLKSAIANKNNKKVRSAETKQRMRISRINYELNNKEEFLKRYIKSSFTKSKKTTEQKLEENKRRSETLKSSKVFQNAIHNPDRLEKIRQALLGHKRSKESIAKQSAKTKGRKMTGDRLLKQQAVISDIHERLGNPGFKTKRFKIGNYTVQGKTEKYYLEQLIKENKTLPFEKKTYIKTPFGYYHPDFEFEDKLVEVKSEFTYDIFEGKEKNSNGEYSINQKKKCLWITENIKPVELVVFNNKYEIVINLVLKSVNI